MDIQFDRKCLDGLVNNLKNVISSDREDMELGKGKFKPVTGGQMYDFINELEKGSKTILNDMSNIYKEIEALKNK